MGLLEEGLSALGIEPEQGRLERLTIYLEELALWNRRLGLVHASGDELIIRHVFDSLAGLPVIRALPHATIADVGSGAGFPGIPLALFLNGARFTLIERSTRSAGFLRNAVALCGLSESVEILERDLSAVRTRFDIVTFRAFRKLSEFVGELLEITKPGGALVAYKGRAEVVRDEIAGIGAKVGRVETHGVTVPHLDEERTIVVIRG